MKREIKFRAWDQYNNEMIYPKKGFFETGKSHGFIVDNMDYPMQYTGLQDKNGKEIYEGDIVDYGYKKSVIVWYDNGFYSAGLTEKCIEYIGLNPYQAYLEGRHCVEMDSVFAAITTPPVIIGNIHENPELLSHV